MIIQLVSILNNKFNASRIIYVKSSNTKPNSKRPPFNVHVSFNTEISSEWISENPVVFILFGCSPSKKNSSMVWNHVTTKVSVSIRLENTFFVISWWRRHEPISHNHSISEDFFLNLDFRLIFQFVTFIYFSDRWATGKLWARLSLCNCNIRSTVFWNYSNIFC